MAEGFLQGVQIANSLFAPLRETWNDQRAMQRQMQQMKMQYDLKREAEDLDNKQRAEGALRILNKGRGTQPIPEFDTAFGKKTARFADSKGNAIDPNSLTSGPSRVPIQLINGQTQDYDLKGIQDALAKYDGISMNQPESKQMYAQLVEAEKKLKGSDLGALAHYKPPESKPLYSYDEVLDFQKAGRLDEMLKEQQLRDALEAGAKYLPENQRGVYMAQALAGSKNPYGAINNAELNPYKIQNLQSQIGNREFNQEHKTNQLAALEKYRERVVELRARGLSETEAHHRATEELSGDRFEAQSARAMMPTTTTTYENPDGSKTSVKQKGGAAPRPSTSSKQPQAKPSKLPPPTYNPSITINRG